MMTFGYIEMNFVPGSKVEVAIKEAKALHSLLNCNVKINLNGWRQLIGTLAIVTYVDMYNRYCESKSTKAEEKEIETNFAKAKEEDYKDFIKLVLKVQKVNKCAAKTLLKLSLSTREELDFDFYDTLDSCFVWGDSKQGFDYWESVSDSMKEAGL